MPSLYYGDEAGMQGLKDPYCRFTYPWGDEDADLLTTIRSLLFLRRHVQALRTGEIEVYAPHPDVLCVARFIQGGFDALGAPARDGVAVALVNRSAERRRVAVELNLHGCDALYTVEGESCDCPGGVLSAIVEPFGHRLLLDRAAQLSLKTDSGFVKTE
jgi:4-alpha-glucanotransferase